ncbi:MAG: hypothetical protein RLZZ393_1059 [Pseudomonadota bacterium]|jgi:hypothetical protein
MGTDRKLPRVAPRYCGPPTSANGGYICGLVADAIGQLVTVRLTAPPPLDTDMTLHDVPDGTWYVAHGDVRVAEARPATLDDLVVPSRVSYLEAMDAARRGPSDPAEHPCPGCFVCGPLRSRGDGLRLFAGPVPDRDIVATGWLPALDLAGSDGKVAPEFIAAALDCPGFQSLRTGRQPWLLGEYTCRIDRRPRVDEPCVIVGWKVESKGRKSIVGTALFDEGGGLCAVARGLWIQPKPPEA